MKTQIPVSKMTDVEKRTESLISEDLRTLASACSTHNRYSSRLWSVAALIGLVVVTGKDTSGGVSLLGFTMDLAKLYPACGALLAAVNIAYCCAHLQTYRTALIFHDYLQSITAKDVAVSEKFSLADAAHALTSPALNRTFPITHFLPESWQPVVFKIFKIFVNFFFFLLPIGMCLFALTEVVTNEPFSWWWIPLGFVSLVSLATSIILLTTAVRWTLDAELSKVQ